MTDQEGFKHFKLKCHEALLLYHRHYEPLGKTPPEHYDRLDFVLFKAYQNGDVPEFIDEPVMDQEVKQLDMFMQRAVSDYLSDEEAKFPEGTLFDNIASETKTDSNDTKNVP
jgi:hypothetical protein